MAKYTQAEWRRIFSEAAHYCWSVARNYPKGQQKQAFIACMRHYLKQHSAMY